MLKRSSAVVLSALAMATALAQAPALEDLILERYHQRVADGDTLTTWRVYADLAEGHTVQMVFGSEKHFLRFETTTEFFNDTLHGAKYGDRVNADQLGEGLTALDSWITVGAASSRHIGVPLHKDNDGSILRGKNFRRTPLAKSDGLMTADVKPVVDFRMQPGYLGNIRGSVILCGDCAWSVLGGIAGPAPDNIVLIAQLTTTGALSYEVNLQIGRPGGGFVRYVAADPQPDEFEHLSLRRLPRRLPQ